MRIRTKIISVVLPLFIATLLITTIISSESARSGITRIAVAALGFKAEQLNKYVESQWNLLVTNNLTGSADYISVAKNAVDSYAGTIVRSKTELILAVDASGAVQMSTSEVVLSPQEKQRVVDLLKKNFAGWVDLSIGGKERVGQTFLFQPFGWYVLVTDEKAVFFSEVTTITLRSIGVLIISTIISVILLVVFSLYLTRPLTNVARAMRGIITDNSLASRVAVEYKDEIGELANTFNIMIGELEKAYRQIRDFAFQAVLAQKNEHKVRNIFQKYVPKEVIDSFVASPESMLLGESRVLAILFSDIRGFTTISEGYSSDELVIALNRYFSMMVDVIMARNGIIDKYIGDAIMAFYGAPVKHEDDALQAVLSGLEMQEALGNFNREQREAGRPEFRIGVGINYGVVTVGNIGSEKKMDYTIIGDMVNSGSRLEGLTKQYHQGLIFSTSVYRKVKHKLYCRLIDKVVVKGKTTGEKIFTAKKALDDTEKTAWRYYHTALNHYYKREFPQALEYLGAAKKLLVDDFVCDMFSDRCRELIKHPPTAEWEGMEIKEEK